MSSNSIAQSLPEILRDVQIMARQKKPFAYVCQIIGWSADKMRDFCVTNGVDFADMPRSRRAGLPMAAIAAVLPAPARGRRYVRSESNKQRNITIAFQTTADLAVVMEQQARERGISKSNLTHRLIAEITRRDWWADILPGGP